MVFQLALLPVDGSAPALAAVEPAVRAVTPDGAVLLLVVIPTVEELLTGIAAASPDARQAFELAEHSHAARREEATQHLATAAARVEAAGGRVAGRVVASGDPGPTILLVAQERGCDVIVMATNGRSGWKRLILGSVAEHVIRNAEDIPVTLVRRSR